MSFPQDDLRKFPSSSYQHCFHELTDGNGRHELKNSDVQTWCRHTDRQEPKSSLLLSTSPSPGLSLLPSVHPFLSAERLSLRQLGPQAVIPSGFFPFGPSCFVWLHTLGSQNTVLDKASSCLRSCTALEDRVIFPGCQTWLFHLLVKWLKQVISPLCASVSVKRYAEIGLISWHCCEY